MRRVAAMGTVLVVLAVGCTNEDAETAEGGDTEAQDSPAQEASPAVEDPADPPDAETQGAEAPSTVPDTEPLARTEHPLAAEDGTLEIELRAEEAGELLRVAVTFTPRDIDAERTSIAGLLGSAGSGNGISARLIDPVNLLEYEAVKPAVAHGRSTPAYVDQPTTLVFHFGAPVEPMETFDFMLDFGTGAPTWPGFVDVPFETA